MQQVILSNFAFKVVLWIKCCQYFSLRKPICFIGFKKIQITPKKKVFVCKSKLLIVKVMSKF